MAPYNNQNQTIKLNSVLLVSAEAVQGGRLHTQKSLPLGANESHYNRGKGCLKQNFELFQVLRGPRQMRESFTAMLIATVST